MDVTTAMKGSLVDEGSSDQRPYWVKQVMHSKFHLAVVASMCVAESIRDNILHCDHIVAALILQLKPVFEARTALIVCIGREFAFWKHLRLNVFGFSKGASHPAGFHRVTIVVPRFKWADPADSTKAEYDFIVDLASALLIDHKTWPLPNRAA
jgi:hypothetical protein